MKALAKILETLPRLADQKVMIVGDLMLDYYVFGTVSRISPEAPVPVVRVERERYVLGGAGNVARNVASLGGDPLLVGAVGKDDDGKKLGDLCLDAGIAALTEPDPGRITTRKTRILAHNQQVVRVDRENGPGLDKRHADRLLEAVADRLPDYGVVILSDYDKGLLSTPLLKRLAALFAAQKPRPLVLVDPKPRNFEIYAGVDLLTPNAKETAEGTGIRLEGRAAIIKAGLALFRKLKPKNLLITLGADGMVLFEGPDKIRHIPTVAQKVFDVTGAGDTVIASIGLALAAGADLPTACALANFAAGIVVGQVGAATATREEIEQAVRESPAPDIAAWLG